MILQFRSPHGFTCPIHQVNFVDNARKKALPQEQEGSEHCNGLTMLGIINFYCKEKQAHTPVLISFPHPHRLWIVCEEREKKLLPRQAVKILSQAKTSCCTPLWRQVTSLLLQLPSQGTEAHPRRCHMGCHGVFTMHRLHKGDCL